MVSAIPERIYLASAKTRGLWVTIAFGESGQLYANSIPSEDKEPSRRLTVEILKYRGFGFDEIGSGDPRAASMAEAVYLAGMEGGKAPHISFEGMTQFQRMVLEQVRSIPRGSVMSYGDVAAAVGHPRAARAVGTTMANNPVPWVVPCHRVVKSDMSPGRFGLGAPVKWDVPEKERLLRSEGVEFSGGKIRARHRLARGKLSSRS